MSTVQSKILLECGLQHPPSAARDRTQSRPEKAMMNNQKTDASLSCRANGPSRSIDRCADFGHSARILNLQAIKSIWPVADFFDPEERVAIIDQFIELRHTAHSDRRTLRMH